jgi:hypothetical protein
LILKISIHSPEQLRTDYLKHTVMRKQGKEEEKGSHGYAVINA